MIVASFRRVARLAALTILFFVALAPTGVRAQESFNSVLVHYQLTMPKVKAWEQASVAMAKALKARKSQIEEDDDDAGGGSMDDMLAKMDAVPEIRRSVHQARLSTREFVTIGMVLMLTMTTEQMQHEYPGAKVPENVNPANLAFMRAHKAEVERSVEAVRAASDTTTSG